MSPEIRGVIIGGVIGSLSSIIGVFVSHLLQTKRDKSQMKLQAERELRRRLTEGIPANIYDKGMEKLFTMIDEGKIPRSYAMDPGFLDTFLEELQEDE